MSSETRDIQRTVLPNGLVIITEAMPQVRSVAAGIWVCSGSRREPAERNGISHFIEHMVFKGTERRSAEDIARAVDSIGGMMDAFTSKELVCFNVKVLDEHLPLAFDILSDLVLRPRFDELEITREKSVVLEEIKMEQDNPDYLVHEIFTQNFWPQHPIGRPILGTPETVAAFDRATLADFFRRWYAPHSMVITAAGSLEHARLVELAAEAFGSLPPGSDGFRETPPEPAAALITHTKRELEQVHICLGAPSLPVAHPARYALAVLNTILGGGMSSRLFQNIRERQGLAYAVFSELSPYRDAGMLSVYAGTGRDAAAQVIASVMAEFRSLKEQPVSEEELRRAIEHLKGSLMLSLESTSARMSNLARMEIYFDRFYDLDEILAGIEAVTAEDVQRLAEEIFHPAKIAATALGALDGFRLTRDTLLC